MRYILLKNHVIAWWNTLKLREKQFISCGIIIASILLFYAGIWSPLENKIAFLNEKISQKNTLNLWLNQIGNEVISLRHSAVKNTVDPQQSLLALIDQESKSNSWDKYIAEMKQIENNQVEIMFDAIDFDRLAIILEQLWEKQAVKVAKLQAQPVDSNSVKLSVIFQR